MAKLKLKRIKFGSYFRELSIVIIGVAVTLCASSIISTIQEKRSLKQQMNAIYAELEDNLGRVKQLDSFYQDTRNLQRLLHADYKNPGTVPDDSIRVYNRVAGRTINYVYKRNAYDMFINSGGMKSFSNKKLLLDITEAYALMETLKQSHSMYTNTVMDFLKEIYNLETKVVTDNMDLRSFRNLYNFHLMSAGDYETTKQAKELLERILKAK